MLLQKHSDWNAHCNKYSRSQNTKTDHEHRLLTQYSNVFRTGGDEFIVIQYDHTEEECVKSLELLREIMSKANVSAALGYAFTSTYNSNFPGLQSLADKNMYEDKERYYMMTGKYRRK